jgi:putative NADH-flavin reductase
MKVAVIGATGNAGSRITTELLKRGHRVRAIVRSGSNITAKNGLEVANNDLSEHGSVGGSPEGCGCRCECLSPTS